MRRSLPPPSTVAMMDSTTALILVESNRGGHRKVKGKWSEAEGGGAWCWMLAPL